MVPDVVLVKNEFESFKHRFKFTQLPGCGSPVAQLRMDARRGFVRALPRDRIELQTDFRSPDFKPRCLL
jgi:hypothetical protein